MAWEIDAVRSILLGLWIAIVLEGLLSFVSSVHHRRPLVLVATLPLFRLTLSPQSAPGWIWLPFTDWRRHRPGLFRRLELRFALSMLMVAVPIILLPLVAFLRMLYKRGPDEGDRVILRR